jgi:hypothetical protein
MLVVTWCQKWDTSLIQLDCSSTITSSIAIDYLFFNIFIIIFPLLPLTYFYRRSNKHFVRCINSARVRFNIQFCDYYIFSTCSCCFLFYFFFFILATFFIIFLFQYDLCVYQQKLTSMISSD